MTRWKEASMWRTDTLWLDVAVVMTIFAVGNILFGHFEQHRPPWRRLLKVVVVLGVTVTLAATLGRAWAYGVLALPLAAAAWVHLVWLPRRGVNGFTGEPRDRYLELVGRGRHGGPAADATPAPTARRSPGP
jgi:hypothetical protein